ncbi:MAG TPA: LysR substrate-binding domain-containing protein [Noviherbaspirillum sp.]|nr:LysR substrate-binding domain-containing protein [Noviherbaspirillum sp.]
MDRFDTMLAFTRVVELNSFTKAAASLNIPKTTLSAQVAALEQRLRVKLLHRTTRHVTVTPDGAAYYERAARLLNDLEETEAAITHLTTSPRGRLRVDIPGSLGRRLIVPALGEFLKRYPEIELEVGCTDRQVDLLQEGVDCVIRGGATVDESLVARRIGSIRLVTCATPGYLREFGTPAVPADLERHHLVHYASPRTGKVYGFAYRENGTEVEIFGHRRMAINDSDACAEAALASIGLIQMPAFIVRDYIAAGRLVPVLEDHPSEELPLCILYPQNRHLSSKVRAFVEWTAELFARPDIAEAAPAR